MRPDEIEAIRQRAEAATPGPWREIAESGEWWIEGAAVDGQMGMGEIICDTDVTEQEDLEFIVHARSDIPTLLEAYDRLKAESDRLTAELQSRSRMLGQVMTMSVIREHERDQAQQKLTLARWWAQRWKVAAKYWRKRQQDGYSHIMRAAEKVYVVAERQVDRAEAERDIARQRFLALKQFVTEAHETALISMSAAPLEADRQYALGERGAYRSVLKEIERLEGATHDT